jgi:gas vesicle protein
LVLTQGTKGSSPQPSPQAEIKKIEVCVTCGGPHSYYNCTATEGNPFEVNAIAGSSNQGGNQYRPQVEPNYRASNQSGPPGFPQNPNRFNPNPPRGPNMQNQTHPPVNQYPPQRGNQGYSAPNYQEPLPNELNNYIKVNETKMRAMQNQISTLKNEFQSSITKQGNELKNELMATNNKIDQSQNKIENMFASLMCHLAPPSTSGGLPGNTVVNPKGELKAITRCSGKAYDEPPLPTTSSPPSKVVESGPEATKDKVQINSPPSSCF